MNLKDCQWYECLDDVKTERGITCSVNALSLSRVARYLSPDGSGCYLIDFHSEKDIQHIDTKWASHIMRLMPQARRELQLKKLGI